ncbi:hypothetical protein BDV93DRAFT_237643 [Ceratobasidium sp. AG-I]|nr:hypothetical protein BDV93DRAFT_237643 [Ceratobasidium sp. AG-I]
MTDIDDPRRSSNGRQTVSNLRELLNKVDIKAGADRSDEREVSTMIESEAERSQSPQSSIREVFAKARTGVPRANLGTHTPSSRLRRESFDSDVSSTPTTMFTPARPREANPGTRPPSHLRMDHLSAGDDDLTQERTPIARAPPQPLPPNASSAASLNALRARLENASETNTENTGDLTGWDRSARSLLTTRGQASTSKFNMYLDDDQETNLLDEDLGGVPALTVSHVDDSNMRFPPSVGNVSRTPVIARSRPGAIPKGPSLQSASIAERLAGIPDDGLDFDDTDRDDFDRNRMDDDSDDLLHNENDLLRSASPPPDDHPSPRRPSVYRALGADALRSARPISGSWENVGEMEESLLALPTPPQQAGDRPPSSQTPKPQAATLPSASSSGSSSGSRLMQTIQAEEDSFEKGHHDKSRQSSEDKSRPSSTVNQSDTTASGRSGKSRLSMFGRSRLPLAKPAPKTTTETSHSISQTSTKSATSEITFPRPTTPTSPSKNAPSVSHTPQSPPKSRTTGSTPPTREGSPTRSSAKLAHPVSPARPVSRLSMSGSPGRPGVPVTPSRIPRVSMHGSHPSWDRMEDSRGTLPDTSPSRVATRPRADSQTPAPVRSQSSLGQASRLTPARSVSSLDHRARGTPPETDVDREKAWGKPLPKLTHANLRMRHDSMESSIGSMGSVVGALSPGRPGSALGGRPTTPSNRSFVGYSVRLGSEVSSSQGSAGSDEDAQLRRSRHSVASPPSKAGMRSGAELRPHSSAASHRSRTTSLTSPTAASLARSGGLVRHTSLKTPSKTSAVGAPAMRHSMSASSFMGSSAASDRASPLASPRAPKRYSVDYGKDLEHIRERDWGRPVNSRAPGLGSGVRPRVVSAGSPSGGRARVVSGESVGERPESPIPRVRGPIRPRPHTIHFGGSGRVEEEGRAPLEGGEELLEEQEEIENGESGGQEMVEGEEDYFRVQGSIMEEHQHTRESAPSPPSPSRSIPLPPSPPRVHAAPADASVSLFRDQPEDMSNSPVAESTRRMIPAQQESPTISFMDTLPPLPGPPSDEDEPVPMIIAPVQPMRPLVNTRLSAPQQRFTRDSSPTSASGSASASERTPRANSLMLQVPSPAQSRTPTPPTGPTVENKVDSHSQPKQHAEFAS